MVAEACCVNRTLLFRIRGIFHFVCSLHMVFAMFAGLVA